MKTKPPLKKQFSTLSMHSHRLSLARSESTIEELEENEKPYDAPLIRIFAMNKAEWPYNLIGNRPLFVQSFGLHARIDVRVVLLILCMMQDVSRRHW